MKNKENKKVDKYIDGTSSGPEVSFLMFLHFFWLKFGWFWGLGLRAFIECSRRLISLQFQCLFSLVALLFC